MAPHQQQVDRVECTARGRAPELKAHTRETVQVAGRRADTNGYWRAERSGERPWPSMRATDLTPHLEEQGHHLESVLRAWSFGAKRARRKWEHLKVSKT